MGRRASSLNQVATGIERDVGSAYDNVRIVADNIDAIIGANSVLDQAHVHGNKAILDTVTAAFTTALETKLNGIETSATADQTGAEIKSLYEAEVNAFTDSLYTKLANIEANAKDDQNASEVPSTPSGTIIATTVQAALDELDAEKAALLGAIFTGDVTVPNLITTGNVDGRDVSVDGTKLDGIESNATADQTDFEIKIAYEANANTNAFTDANVTTLSTAIQSSEKASANGVATLDGAGLVPPSQLPSYVDDVLEYATHALLPGTGEADKIYVVVADETDNGNTNTYRWTGTVYARITDTMDPDEVKSLYEGNADTNAFTDADHTKLDGIEAGAQYDILQNHGIESGLEFSVNANPDLYDVSAGVYWIDGVKYTYAGSVGNVSSGLAGSFTAVGITVAGLVEVPGNFIDLATAETTLEVTTYAKLTDTTIDVFGNSKDNTTELMKDAYLRMKYFESSIFKNGAGTTTLSSTPLQLDMAGGTVSGPNGKRVTIPTVADIAANPIYSVAGVDKIHPKLTPLVIDATVYDNGTELVSLPAAKYVSHTVVRSIRTGTNYFIYGHTLYDTLGAAQAAEPNLDIFSAVKEGSYLEALAVVITQEGVGDVLDIIDVREGREANTIDSIAGKTITNMVSGDVLKFDGNQLVAESPVTSVGQGVSLFLGNNIISGDNYDLTTSPAGGGEVAIQQTANSGDSPKFIERYVSDPLGGTSIDGGAWTFSTYASVDANQGITDIVARINHAVVKAGTLTSAGTGQTRTFTATEAGTFVSGDADASILNATLIETPTETFWIDSFISDTQVTATTDGVGYVNESSVAFSLYYKLFEVTAAADVTGTDPTLYSVGTVQPAFPVAPEDRLLVAYFLNVTTGTNKTVSLYKNGTDNYSHFDTPLVTRHNSLAGLNEDDYQHLTVAEKTSLTNHEISTSNPHSVTKTQVGLANVDNTSDVNKPVSTAQQTAIQNTSLNNAIAMAIALG